MRRLTWGSPIPMVRVFPRILFKRKRGQSEFAAAKKGRGQGFARRSSRSRKKSGEIYSGPFFLFAFSGMTTPFRWPVRVYWEDTDAGGVVYHARYLAFMERARSVGLRACGWGLDAMRGGDENVLIA